MAKWPPLYVMRSGPGTKFGFEVDRETLNAAVVVPYEGPKYSPRVPKPTAERRRRAVLVGLRHIGGIRSLCRSNDWAAVFVVRPFVDSSASWGAPFGLVGGSRCSPTLLDPEEVLTRDAATGRIAIDGVGLHYERHTTGFNDDPDDGWLEVESSASDVSVANGTRGVIFVPRCVLARVRPRGYFDEVAYEPLGVVAEPTGLTEDQRTMWIQRAHGEPERTIFFNVVFNGGIDATDGLVRLGGVTTFGEFQQAVHSKRNVPPAQQRFSIKSAFGGAGVPPHPDMPLWMLGWRPDECVVFFSVGPKPRRTPTKSRKRPTKRRGAAAGAGAGAAAAAGAGAGAGAKSRPPVTDTSHSSSDEDDDGTPRSAKRLRR